MSTATLPCPVPGTDHAYGPAPSQFGRLHRPAGDGPAPVLMLLHGGYWKARQTLDSYPTRNLVEPLVAAGVAVWNVEYRRMGEAGGGLPGTLEDAAAALQQLVVLAGPERLDLSRVVLLGHSAGGHLAAWLAGRWQLPTDDPLAPAEDALRPAHALVVGGIPDLEAAWHGGLGNPIILPRLMPGSPEQCPEAYARASACRLVPPVCPVSVVHGLDDVDVSPDQGRRYDAAVRAAGGDSRLIELPDCDHQAMLAPGSAGWRELFGALSRRAGLPLKT